MILQTNLLHTYDNMHIKEVVNIHQKWRRNGEGRTKAYMLQMINHCWLWLFRQAVSY